MIYNMHDNYPKLVILFVWHLLFYNTLFAKNEIWINQVNDTIPDQFNSIQKPIFHLVPNDFRYKGIRCILKDHVGIMWFGTADGLVKFDGIYTNLYQNNPDDKSSLSHNIINAIVEDKDKNLWIGTSCGLNLYNRDQDNFLNIDTTDDRINILNYSYIKSLYIDDDNVLWIGTFGYGLNAYEIKTNKLIRYTYDSAKVNTRSLASITSIIADTLNNLWIGTQSGLSYLEKESGTIKHFHNNSKNPTSISGNHITSLHKDLDGHIWVGTQTNGVNLIVKQNSTFHFITFNTNSKPVRLSSNQIHSIHADKKGNLWIGSANCGLDKLNIRRTEVQNFRNEINNNKSISSNSVWSIYDDNDGRIWIGTYNKGINVIDENILKFESYIQNTCTNLSLPDNDVTGFAEDKYGKIWIATDGGGLCWFDIKSRSIEQVITSENGNLTKNLVQTVLCSSTGRVWVGTWGGGIDLLSSSGKLIRNYKIESESGVGNNNVKTIHQDKKGNIWAGTNGSGLFLFDKEQNIFKPIVFRKILTQSTYINSIISDSEGILWIGTENGLFKLNFIEINNDNPSCKVFRSNNSKISSNTIVTLYLDSNENIWAGTSSEGVNLITKSNEEFVVFKGKDGIASSSISGILEDNEGNIWVSTNAGISRIDLLSNEIKTYTKDDGLNSNEFYINSCLKLRNGCLLFGGEYGFNLFNPKNIKVNNHIPEILLTRLMINNVSVQNGTESSPLRKHISQTDLLVLNHKQTSFSIEFVALNYTQPTKNRFSYILEGYDKDWNYIGTKNSANYTQVKPGKYVFKVKGSNNDNIWNNDPATLKIIIKPPFYKTWLAFVFYILVLIIITIAILNSWKEKMKIKNQLELERLATEKEQELNELNIQFFTHISHEFRTPLSLIIGSLESLINSTQSKIKERLMTINKNANRLLSLTNKLLDIRKLEERGMKLKIQEVDVRYFILTISDYFKFGFENQNIHFSIDFPETDISGWFDQDKIATILTNLLSNAIKHTPNKGKICLKVQCFNPIAKKGQNPTINLNFRILEVSVIDSGIGIPAEDLPYVFDKFFQAYPGKKISQQGSGIGLTLTKRLVELHKGTIWVESKPEKETKFTFSIPIDKNAYQPEEMGMEEFKLQNLDVFIDGDNEPKNTLSDNIENTIKDNRPKVLIVEDNSDLKTFFKQELGKEYFVIISSDGEEGYEKAINTTPDLIISDVIMPKKSGIELCKDIKSDMRTSHIPFILLTAKTTTKEQIEGINTGADAYITKPFNLDLLLTQVKNLIFSRRELYAHFSKDLYIMPKKIASSELDQKFLQKTLDFLLVNITDEQLSVENLASYHNMSHSNVYRKIKALTGNTVVEFIRIVRLKEALKLMEKNKYSLAEISYMTGFNSQSYFTKIFKKEYGMTPSDYMN